MASMIGEKMETADLKDDLFLMFEAAKKIYNVDEVKRMKVSWARIYKILEETK